MAEVSTRVCNVCGFDLPLTAHHFDRKRDAPDGFREVCKQCRHDERASKSLTTEESDRQGGHNEVASMFDKRTLQLLAKSANSPSTATRLPHKAELYEELITRLGGASGLADHMIAVAMASGPGSETRRRVLTEVLRLAIDVSNSNQADQRVEDMSYEDLVRQVRKLALADQMARLPQAVAIEVIEASPTNVTASTSDSDIG